MLFLAFISPSVSLSPHRRRCLYYIFRTLEQKGPSSDAGGEGLGDGPDLPARGGESYTGCNERQHHR